MNILIAGTVFTYQNKGIVKIGKFAAINKVDTGG